MNYADRGPTEVANERQVDARMLEMAAGYATAAAALELVTMSDDALSATELRARSENIKAQVTKRINGRSKASEAHRRSRVANAAVAGAIMNEQAWTTIYNAVEVDVLERHACLTPWPAGLSADDVELCARYGTGLSAASDDEIMAAGNRVLSALR